MAFHPATALTSSSAKGGEPIALTIAVSAIGARVGGSNLRDSGPRMRTGAHGESDTVQRLLLRGGAGRDHRRADGHGLLPLWLVPRLARCPDPGGEPVAGRERARGDRHRQARAVQRRRRPAIGSSARAAGAPSSSVTRRSDLSTSPRVRSPDWRSSRPCTSTAARRCWRCATVSRSSRTSRRLSGARATRSRSEPALVRRRGHGRPNRAPRARSGDDRSGLRRARAA